MTFKTITVTVFSLFMFGCANPHVVQERQIGDNKLSCSAITNQIAEAEQFERKARREKGVTGTNVAAALFFWPAMLVTFSNAGDAIEAANERKRHLHKLYTDKGCDSGSSSAKKENEESLSKRIMELNELYKQGAISEDEYKAAKQKALGL